MMKGANKHGHHMLKSWCRQKPGSCWKTTSAIMMWGWWYAYPSHPLSLGCHGPTATSQSRCDADILFISIFPPWHTQTLASQDKHLHRGVTMSSRLRPLHICMTPYSVYILISLWFSILKLPFSTSHSSMVVGLKLLHKMKTCSKTGETHNTGHPFLSPHCYKVKRYFSNHINK